MTSVAAPPANDPFGLRKITDDLRAVSARALEILTSADAEADFKRQVVEDWRRLCTQWREGVRATLEAWSPPVGAVPH